MFRVRRKIVTEEEKNNNSSKDKIMNVAPSFPKQTLLFRILLLHDNGDGIIVKRRPTGDGGNICGGGGVRVYWPA